MDTSNKMVIDNQTLNELEIVGINIQTMLHHGGMVVLGVSLLAHHVKLTWKSLLKASIVFASLMVIAMALNGIHNNWIMDGTFNMFFINHKYENGVPVLMIFQPLVPHAVFLLIYLFGFMFCASIVFGIRYGLSKMVIHKKATYQNA